jgi:hypothetical protein
MTQNAFLFPWNPKKWPWPELSEAQGLLRKGLKVQEEWHCDGYKQVRKGDRAFLIKVGTPPRGIFGSGFVCTEPFLINKPGRTSRHNVLINIDVLLDPDHDDILTVELLKIGSFAKQLWTPQSSGILIKKELRDELEELWADFLRQ